MVSSFKKDEIDTVSTPQGAKFTLKMWYYTNNIQVKKKQKVHELGIVPHRVTRKTMVKEHL